MLKPSVHTDSVAFRLFMKPEDIDQPTLKKVVRAVQYKQTVYFDALANKGQLAGNVPKIMSIALTYDFLTNG